MALAQKDPVLVVLQLTGGNDYLNTVIPYNNPLYQDNRKAVGIPESQILAFDNEYGFPPYLAPLKKIWDENKLAIMHGVGYLDSPRSHFRSMDIWHTCEAEKVGTEGWLGRVVREFDPKKENVVTAVSFGPCLFRALAVPGVPVACVAGSLERYGFLPNIQVTSVYSEALGRQIRVKVTTNGLCINVIDNAISVNSPDDMNAIVMAGRRVYDLGDVLLLAMVAVDCVRHLCD